MPSGGRCRWYDADGTPVGKGCFREKDGTCNFIHPSHPGWATAYPPPPHFRNDRDPGNAGSSAMTGSNRDPVGPGKGWGAPRGPRRRESDAARPDAWGDGPGGGTEEMNPPAKEGDGGGNSAAKKVASGWGDLDDDSWKATANTTWGDPVEPSLSKPGWNWGSPPDTTGWGDDSNNTWKGASWGTDKGKEKAGTSSASGWGWGASVPKETPTAPKAFSEDTAGPSIKDPRKMPAERAAPGPSTSTVPQKRGWGDDLTDAAPSSSKTFNSNTTATKNTWATSPRRSSPPPESNNISGRKPLPSSSGPAATRTDETTRWRSNLQPVSRKSQEEEYTGMLLAPESPPAVASPLVEESDVDMELAYPSFEEPIDASLAEWKAYMGDIIKAVALQNDLTTATQRHASTQKLQKGKQFLAADPLSGARSKINALAESDASEVADIQAKLDEALQNLADAKVPVSRSTSALTTEQEEELEDFRRYLQDVKTWHGEVRERLKEAASKEARTAEETRSRAKLDALEEKVSELEMYMEELTGGSLTDLKRQVAGQVTAAREELDEIYDVKKHESMCTDMKMIQDQLTNSRAAFQSTKDLLYAQLPAPVRENISYRLQLQELQQNFADHQTALRANDAEIQRLRTILEDLQSSHPPPQPSPEPAPIPVLTEDALIEIILPLLRQAVREDMAEAMGALKTGVERALEKYHNQLSGEVWGQLIPILKFVHGIKQRIAQGQAANAE
ncbi:hypothetical protein EIP91_001924 [Steccherinum ochraceum]|uniref:C3H1-type domain-containing protein n=1 Tax=Steccherinum ochraceum TaxID=92696 RepID=A0A4R0RTV5_9APHY|nr:hypothetical protein EIP91_001924 [Steccherinum ochraceum]